MDSANNDLDLATIGRFTEQEISIGGHYSKAVVPCGTGCVAFWIVDRQTGAVIGIPDTSQEGQSIYDLEGNADSDIVRVVYGASDGTSDKCEAKDFRLTSNRLELVSTAMPITCP